MIYIPRLGLQFHKRPPGFSSGPQMYNCPLAVGPTIFVMPGSLNNSPASGAAPSRSIGCEGRNCQILFKKFKRTHFRRRTGASSQSVSRGPPVQATGSLSNALASDLLVCHRYVLPRHPSHHCSHPKTVHRAHGTRCSQFETQVVGDYHRPSTGRVCHSQPCLRLWGSRATRLGP